MTQFRERRNIMRCFHTEATYTLIFRINLKETYKFEGCDWLTETGIPQKPFVEDFQIATGQLQCIFVRKDKFAQVIHLQIEPPYSILSARPPKASDNLDYYGPQG